MGWRAAKASGNASMPVDEGGSFAQGFASTFVPMLNEAVSSYADEQKEKRMLELKEELYRKREAVKNARSASAASAKDAKALRVEIGEAKSWLEFHGIPVNETNINGALQAADNIGGDGTARWSKLTTAYGKEPTAFTWKGGVQGGAPKAVAASNVVVPADTAIVDPADAMLADPTATEEVTPDQTDDLEAADETSTLDRPASELPSVFNDNLGQGIDEVVEPESAVAGQPQQAETAEAETEDSDGFASMGVDPGSVQFVSFTAPTAEEDPTAEPVVNVGTGFGYKPKTAVPTAFKEAEITVSSITSYKEWLAASQALRISNSEMTAEQQGEWNEYGKRLYEVANSSELDFTGLDSLSDVQAWEETYRSKMGADATAALPTSIEQSLARIRGVVEAEANSDLSLEQRMLKRYMSEPEFKDMDSLDQAMFIRNYGLLGKSNYATVEEARMALNLADSIGAPAGEMNRITHEIDKFERQPGARVTQKGYTIVDKGGVPVLESVSYYDQNGTLYNGVTNEPLSTNLMDVDEGSVELWRAQTSGLRDYNKNVGAFIGLSLTLQDIVDVASVDERSLSTVAGVLRNFDSFMTEAETLSSLLLEQPEDSLYTQAQFERDAAERGLFKEGETLDSLTSPEALKETLAELNTTPNDTNRGIQLIAKLRRMLDAKFAIAQFQVGAAEGQSSTAMSNTDRVEFRKFLSGFRNVEDLAANYASYMSNRLATLQTQGAQYGPNSATARQFAADNFGAFPTAGIKTVAEQIEDHPQGDRLGVIFNNIKGGQFVESPSNPYRPGNREEASPAPQTSATGGGNSIEPQAIMDMDDAAFSEFQNTFKTSDGKYDFTALGKDQIAALLERYKKNTTAGVPK
jgi:hypothetical protein